MGDHRARIGQLGEELAAGYLQAKGYLLIERRWRCARGELDLIMRDGATLVIVEVRSRRGPSRGAAEESVDAEKCRRLALLTELYLQHQARQGAPWTGPWRIDVVAVALTGQGSVDSINHLQHAVEEDFRIMG